MEVIHTKNAPAPIGPYSQAVKANGFLFVSGQIALNPETGLIDSDEIQTETIRVMENLKAVLAAGNSSLEKVVKCSIFLSDMDLFGEVNKIYGRYFNQHEPARETVAVKTLPKSVNVEISVIALC